MRALTVIVSLCVGATGSAALAAEPVSVPAGRFAPLFGLDVGQSSFAVAAFRIDVRPVSQNQFAAFLARQPQWRRENVSPALSDSAYLASWPKVPTAAPVTEVSYFAARAYCESQGGALPTTLQWEYVAAADETKADASRDPAFVKRILDWYSRPNQPSDLMAQGSPKNVYGAEAMHGLVWEWTEDFNAVFVSGDNRQDGDLNSKFTCGNGATGSARREDYAAFMRYALRSSLTAKTALPRLGFRCAYPPEAPMKK